MALLTRGSAGARAPRAAVFQRILGIKAFICDVTVHSVLLQVTDLNETGLG